MIAMNRRGWTGGRPGQLAITAAALLMLMVSIACLSFGHHAGLDDHGRIPGLCAGVAVFAIVVVLVAGGRTSGRLRLESILSAYAVSLSLLDPPPKPLPA